jgi:hypothetical protein
MASPFTDADYDRLTAALGVPAKREGEAIRYDLADAESGRRLVLEVHPHVAAPGAEPQALVTVYGMNAFLQLQNVTGLLASEELGEAIFIARRDGATHGLVVERGAGCSLYANVDDRLLDADFTQLPAEVMMSAVALSMSASLFGDLP